MNPLDFLNNNPALISIVAFPMGVLMLFGVAKTMKLDALLKSIITAINNHTVAELKIGERLSEVVSELKSLIAANWDNRRYLDDKVDHFNDRLDQITSQITRLETLLPKRKDDPPCATP